MAQRNQGRLTPRALRALGLGEMRRGGRSSREASEAGSGVLTLERHAEALQQHHGGAADARSALLPQEQAA